jgi:hypothetical protein
MIPSDVDKRRRSEKLRADMRRLANISGITFALCFLWKVALLLFTSQPIPANDSFFYDGPVVNYILHGKYCNPSLAMVLPISGNEVFSAYPPLYQFVLLGWMKCFGTSELAAMWLHLTLLAGFALTVWQIFRQLNTPALAVNIAGLFLFGITFHDRPDTLAHLLAALAVLALVRALPWATAVFLTLTFCASLQIGGIYSLWLGLFVVGEAWLARRPIPWAALLSFAGVLVALIALVKFGHPRLWEGFREHVAITPSFTGLRAPRPDDILKIVRTSPGILLVVAMFVPHVFKWRELNNHLAASTRLRLVASGTLAALALMSGCLVVLTPNTIHVANYLQPVIVGGALALMTVGSSLELKWRRTLHVFFLAAALLVSIRAIGMTTWGVLCHRDVNRNQAFALVNQSLDSAPDDCTVFVSAAYLYDVAQRTNITWLHSDWTAHSNEGDWELRAIKERRPSRLILTQFDYCRRYERIVSQFRRERGDVAVEIINTARVQPPDAIPSMRKVVQHISWAPVIVEFTWPSTTETK